MEDHPQRFLLLFVGLILVSTMPLWVSCYFPSLDSPAHLYNAKLIVELWHSDSWVVNHFYQFNNYIVPNWLGHVMLAAFYTVFGEWWLAEKSVLVLYFISIPFAFDYFIRNLNGNRWLSFWSLPFVFSFVFSIGFYNYSLSIIFALLFLSKAWYFFERTFSRKEILGLFFLLCLLYFSHGFTFLLTISLWSVSSLPILFTLWKGRVSRTWLFKRLLLAVLLVLPLLVFYKWNTAYHNGSPVFLETAVLVKDLLRWRSFIVYHELEEQGWTQLMCGLSMLLLFIAVVKSKIRFHLQPLRVFCMIGLLLVFYFLLPDNTGSAGFISVRILGWLAMGMVLVISVCEISKWVVTVSTLIMLVAHFGLLSFHTKVVHHDAEWIDQTMEIQNHIVDHSIVHFDDLSGDWRFQHFSNFVALKANDVACTENYEAAVDYFPLIFEPKAKDHNDALECAVQTILMKPFTNDSMYRVKLSEHLALGDRIVFENERIVLLQSKKK